MSKDTKKYPSDSCPMCKHPIKLRKIGVVWEMRCVRCQCSTRGDNRDKVFGNWVKFRTVMEKMNIKKKNDN